MNKIIKNTFILTLITVVAGFLLGAVYEVTKDPIAATKEKAKQEACQKVFPEADTFEMISIDEDAAKMAIELLGRNASVDEAYIAKMNNEQAGYVITTTDKGGYGGDIQISVGVMNDGSVNGISILTISETAGLGMKATEPEFYNQYSGVKTPGFYTEKDKGSGKTVDTISGATITTRAVNGAVNLALNYYRTIEGGSVNE